MNNKTRQFKKILSRFKILSPMSLVAVLLIPAVSADAQEWRLQPEVRIGAEYDDNARLRTAPAQIQEIDGFNLEGSLGIGYLTPRSNLLVTPRLRSRVYDETPDVDSDDQFLKLNYNYEGQKSNFKIRGNYDRESIRTAERTEADIDIDDPDEIPTDDTGITDSNERRERLRFVPEWNYELTQRLSIGLQYTYMDVSYDDNAVTTLTDYTDQRVRAVLSRQLSQRTRGYLGVGARQYENELGTNDVDGVGATIGMESELSETTRFQVEVGYEDTEQSTTGQSDSNFIANINLVRRLETITMLAQYRRDVAAAGSGKVSARDSLNFNFKKQFTERVSGGLGIRAYQSDAVGEQSGTFQERDQFEARASLEVALSRAFLLEADYSYTRLDRSDQDGTADSNNIILWLVYRPTPKVY